MVKPFPSKTHIGNHMLHPETLTSQNGTTTTVSCNRWRCECFR